MKKLDNPNGTHNREYIQEKIDEMLDDLLTVLESFMDDFDTEDLFYNAIKFMTVALYDCAENHTHALKILRLAMDAGIKIYIDNKKEAK